MWRHAIEAVGPNKYKVSSMIFPRYFVSLEVSFFDFEGCKFVYETQSKCFGDGIHYHVEDMAVGNTSPFSPTALCVSWHGAYSTRDFDMVDFISKISITRFNDIIETEDICPL
jgi:hypothetical protein